MKKERIISTCSCSINNINDVSNTIIQYYYLIKVPWLAKINNSLTKIFSKKNSAWNYLRNFQLIGAPIFLGQSVYIDMHRYTQWESLNFDGMQIFSNTMRNNFGGEGGGQIVCNSMR